MRRMPARYTVTLDRLDGGEAIEDREVFDVQLRDGVVTISDGAAPVFRGREWRWLEVRRIDDTPDLALAPNLAPAAGRRPRAGPRARRPR